MLTKQELDFVIEQEFTLDFSKLTLKKLQIIMNKIDTTKKDSFCMCNLSQRKQYKREFYIYLKKYMETNNDSARTNQEL